VTDPAAPAVEGEVATTPPDPTITFDDATLAALPATGALGETTLHVARDDLRDVVAALRDEGWLMCLDVSAVDYLTYDAPRELPAGVEPERFELVVLLISHNDKARLRLRVQVPEADPVVPTLFELHPGTEAMEREVFDMFGIRFEGHPDMRRILMPEDYEGFPQRRDFPMGGEAVLFTSHEPKLPGWWQCAT
jgi:NADH-quinone oxidoreductase subunit C